MNSIESKPTVLIFEDDIQLVQEWKQELKKNDIHFDHSWDVENAIQLCSQKKYNAIICDVFIKDEAGNLKNEAGVTLINYMRYQLKGAPKWGKTVPFLVVTGSPVIEGFDILTLLKSMGTSLTMRKPFSPSTLVNRVLEIIKHQES